jgi:prevent-host-death family protein
MKVIPLSEAKANLSRYGRMCQEEPVIVTVNGVPSFQLAPLEEDDDLIDRLLAENPEFGQLLEQRSRERTVSMAEARKRLRS